MDDHTAGRRYGAAAEVAGTEPGSEHVLTRGATERPCVFGLGHRKPFPCHGGHG